ncbi:MAG: alpha/beta fold hydrolase [Elusimicrobia bacterium]|nr:alpha/beta fold hydrolase [Elusimicrobiota bacterium]
MRQTIVALAVFLVLSASAAAEPVKVKFKSGDGTTLVGLYQKPAPGKGVAIMLHGLKSSKEEYKPLADRLGAAGWGTLAYDARGHGESAVSRTPNGEADYASLGQPGPGSRWERMIDDVGAAIKFVQDDAKVERSSIVVVGASMGANVVARYAALAAPVKGIVLLSPGLDFVGFKPKPEMPKIHCPILLIAARADVYSYQSCLELKTAAPSSDLWNDVPNGHGVQMLDGGLIDRIKRWMEKER